MSSIFNAEEEAILDEFDALRRDHFDRLFVKWRLDPPSKERTAWYFCCFGHRYMYPGPQPAKGVGRIALAEVCALADKHGLRIDLDTYEEERAPRLHVYYKSFGFRKIAAPLRASYGHTGFTRAPRRQMSIAA